MRALVTGAGGFVGNATCRALLHSGHSVHALSRDPARLQNADALMPSEAFETFAGSVADPNLVAAAAEGCEVVFHTAGIAHPRCPERVAKWLHVAGTENVLNAAHRAGCKRVVHVSCADATLHDGDRLHWDEARTPTSSPVGPHARSKLVSEEMALARGNAQLEVTAVRPAWLWGAGDFGGVAYLSALSAGKGVPLYGDRRNLIATTHIDNLTRAMLAAAVAPAAPSRAYLITDAAFVEAREFFGMLSKALGLPAPRVGGSLPLARVAAALRRLSGQQGLTTAEVLRLGRGSLFDLSRAVQDLGYEPDSELQPHLDALEQWVREEGGLDAVVRRARPLPAASDVDEQVRAAGGD